MTNEEFGQMMSDKNKKSKRAKLFLGITILVIITAFITISKYMDKERQRAEDEKYHNEFVENQIKAINTETNAVEIERIIGSMRTDDFDKVKPRLDSLTTKTVYWETGKIYYDDFTNNFIKENIIKQNGTYSEYLNLKKSGKELIEKIYLPSKNIRAKRLKDKYGWDVSTCLTISKGSISIGMTSDMVREAWGRPNDVNRTTYSFGVHEQWVYGSGNYVYFEDGKVTTIQN